MNCLITGAAGFIGNALLHRLARDGHHVTALVHEHQPTSLDSNVTYTTVDITDPFSVQTVVQNIDVVFHCAALVKDFGSKEDIMNVNFQGTKHLVKACEGHIQRFIYLGHLPYESIKNVGYYNMSKSKAEQYLLEKNQREKFPVVIIRPGNVYGPSATTWVLRPLNAIQRNRITLINKGQGIFLHTYIDNLIDALVTVMHAPNVEGEIINVTDGDNTTTWGRYLNDLAEIAGKKPITRTLSTHTALLISKKMMLLYHLFRVEPWVTPTAVHIFANTQTVSLEKAEHLLQYKPSVDYTEGMKRVRQWLQKEHYV